MVQSCEHCGTGQTMGAGAGPSSEGTAGLGRGTPKGRGEKDSKADRQPSNLPETCECRCDVSGLHRGGRDPKGSRRGEQLFGHTLGQHRASALSLPRRWGGGQSWVVEGGIRKVTPRDWSRTLGPCDTAVRVPGTVRDARQQAQSFQVDPSM